MIPIETITESLNLAQETSIRAVDSEISLYSISALQDGRQIRLKLNYLELYCFTLNSIQESYDGGVYKDSEWDEDSIMKLIENVNELCSVIFDITL